jgi:hypothetical protein
MSQLSLLNLKQLQLEKMSSKKSAASFGCQADMHEVKPTSIPNTKIHLMQEIIEALG